MSLLRARARRRGPAVRKQDALPLMGLVGGLGLVSLLALRRSPPPGAPLTPTGLAVLGTSSGSVSLSWGPSNTASSYTLRRDGAIVAVTAQTSFTDSAGLLPLHTYAYTVAANRGDQSSAPSAAVLAVTLADPNPPPPPALPGGLHLVAASSAQVAIAWNAVPGASGYPVYRDGMLIATLPEAAYTDSEVAPDTAYAYRVAASNAGGSSGQSAPLEVQTPPAPAPPAVPSGLHTAQLGFDHVSLAWNPAAQASSYELRRDGVLLATVPNLAFTDQAVQASSTYAYTLRALNALGASAESPALLVRTPDHYLDSVALEVSHGFSTAADGPLDAFTAWTPASAPLSLSLTDPTGTTVLGAVSGSDGQAGLHLAIAALPAGMYSLRIQQTGAPPATGLSAETSVFHS